ncbi:MAG: YihY/virulence factor BrkB family protein, partial [Pseudomonadota bacterium]
MQLLDEKIDRFLWSAKLAERPWWIQFMVRFSRQVFALFRDLIGGQLTLRAMSLVYTTLLSVVPLLAFSFSMFKAFKIDDNNLKDKLTELTAPLGDAGADVTEKVLNVVDNVQGSLLGTLSLAFFIYTAIAMVQKVESSFNYIWRVDKPRALARRVTEYLSILLIGPIVMAIALSMIASISNDTLVARIAAVEPFGSAMLLAGKVLPYIIVISVFTFLYKYLPNARVRFRSALIGGITAGVLWAFAGVVFANFVANSAQTNAIYATFAVAISTLIWLYLSWLILLIGAQVAFYTQHPIFLRLGRQDPRLSNGLREKIALN